MSHTERSHARLAPSSATRWMNCPGSVALSDGIADVASTYANEGTAAHMLAERCMESGFDAERFAGHVVDIREAGERSIVQSRTGIDGVHVFEVDEDMVEGVQMYLDACRALVEPGDAVLLETWFDMAEVIPDMSGTSDFTVHRMADRRLIVRDFKYGRGVVVDAIDNFQGVSYALGALINLFGPRPQDWKVDTVDIGIVQPRAEHPAGRVRKWTLTLDEFNDCVFELKVAARRTKKDTDTFMTGDWCRFCRAQAICPAKREQVRRAAMTEFDVVADPNTYDRDALAAAMAEVDAIENWCKHVREFAHSEALHGRCPDGWKLVEGRSLRQWKDPDAAAGWLEEYGMDRDDIFDLKMRSPAAVEKVIGKASADDIKGLWTKPEGKPVLAPADDKRSAISLGPQHDFEKNT